MLNRDDDGDENGSLGDVSAEVLLASKDVAAWREQRREAIRLKILSRGAGAGAGD